MSDSAQLFHVERFVNGRAFFDLGVIFPKESIEHPVTTIFNAPVLTNELNKLLSGGPRLLVKKRVCFDVFL